ncbi:hypothetical protein GCM10023323_67160 [Streptomyces thinghirensis]|uniref:Uncharacterized protein n=1 Tax=Streptomyces thinghirensis TaxID=551547 RepID=A0ABP9TH17_9ACTN
MPPPQHPQAQANDNNHNPLHRAHALSSPLPTVCLTAVELTAAADWGKRSATPHPSGHFHFARPGQLTFPGDGLNELGRGEQACGGNQVEQTAMPKIGGEDVVPASAGTR